MSRMLRALRQIEAKSLEPAPADATVPASDATGPTEPDASQRPQAEPPADNEALMAAALARIDSAAAMAAGELGAREAKDASIEPAVAASPSVPWPAPNRPVRWSAAPTEGHVRAYQKLAEKLLGLVPRGGRATWMFTSPRETDGTTEVLAPLGAALVERTADEVLLVDANLRRPSLSRYLGIEPARGLADVLLGAADWREVLRPTSLPRLRLLPGVRFPDADGRVPLPDEVAPLLGDLGRTYRWVLIDAASLARPEVACMAAHCDGVLLVVRLHRTTQAAVGRSVGAIRDSGGCLLGSVVLGA